MTPTLSTFARSLHPETAFTVLAIAKQLKAAGKDVVELEIGDSPLPSPAAADRAGIEAIRAGKSHYCPSPGLPELREAAAAFVREEFQIPATAANIAVAAGAKPFEQFFCEAFLNPGDGVLLFSPHFPTYEPNILRRGARPVLATLRQADAFRPLPDDVARFLADDPAPRAIFLNSPHNPTGGVATEQDLRDIADLVRGRDIAVFSDEPYCHMVWQGRHRSIAALPEMLDQTLAAYSFSKSYSMSGWRLGFCVAAAGIIEAVGNLINTTLSCTPPLVQLAGVAALQQSHGERDEAMLRFKQQVVALSSGLATIPGMRALPPSGTFYVFANVQALCDRWGITSHGLAMYLLEGADDDFGVACLGGECFGSAGSGFLRFSCAEPVERIEAALDFLPRALANSQRLQRWVDGHRQYAAEQAAGR